MFILLLENDKHTATVRTAPTTFHLIKRGSDHVSVKIHKGDFYIKIFIGIDRASRSRIFYIFFYIAVNAQNII